MTLIFVHNVTLKHFLKCQTYENHQSQTIQPCYQTLNWKVCLKVAGECLTSLVLNRNFAINGRIFYINSLSKIVRCLYLIWHCTIYIIGFVHLGIFGVNQNSFSCNVSRQNSFVFVHCLSCLIQCILLLVNWLKCIFWFFNSKYFPLFRFLLCSCAYLLCALSTIVIKCTDAH